MTDRPYVLRKYGEDLYIKPDGSMTADVRNAQRYSVDHTARRNAPKGWH